MSSIYARDFRVAGNSLDMKDVPRATSRTLCLCVNRPLPLRYRNFNIRKSFPRYPSPAPLSSIALDSPLIQDYLAHQYWFELLLIECSRSPHIIRLPLFRQSSSIVVRGWGAFAEDSWTKIKAGGIAMRTPKPCSRCQVPSINQTTLERRAEPRVTLGAFR